MSFCGKEPSQSKIYLDDKILVRVNEFNYLGYNLAFKGESDISKKN